MQSVMGKLSPESFLNNQNWAYLWIKSVKFHAVFFIACQVESCQNILKLSCRSLVIDSNFSFNKHINNLCKKASTKFNALTRISGYMDLPKRRMIMKLSKTSSFGYCPLIWMFHSRAWKNKNSFNPWGDTKCFNPIWLQNFQMKFSRTGLYRTI